MENRVRWIEMGKRGVRRSNHQVKNVVFFAVSWKMYMLD